MSVGVSFIAGVFGILSILGLDFSDQEIEASLVDTWQASLFGGYLLLGLTAVIAVISFLFAKHSVGIHREKLRVTGWIASASFLLQFVGMCVLTRRAELLTGHNLSGPLNLF